jgi:oryzin
LLFVDIDSSTTIMFSKTLLGVFAAAAAVASALPTTATAGSALPGKCIVRLKPDVESHLAEHTEWVSHVHSRNLARRGGDSNGIEKTYSFSNFEDYAGSFDDVTLEAIRASSDVSPPLFHVEPW